MLIQANDVKEAFENTDQAMQGTTGDYSIPAITESTILDVFPYFTGEEEEINDTEAETSEVLEEKVSEESEAV